MKIKDLFKELLAICVLVPLLHNFCGAFQKIDLQVYGSSSNRVAKPSSVSMPYVICGSNGITLYTCMSSNTPNCASFTFTPPSAYSSWGDAVSSCYYYNYTSYDVNQYLYASADTTVSYYVLTDCSDSGSSCDYSSYESEISTLSGNLATCNSNLATATGNLATCNSNLATATGNLASCQSDLTSCQSQLPNGGSCSVSTYNSIAYSGDVSLSANGTVNAIDLGNAPNKTLCITLSGNLGNNNYVNIGFYGNTTNVASDSQEYWYDQVGKTVCMYANKRYFNINNPKATNPTISYEAYFLNDLLSKSVPCEEGFLGYTQSQCESEYNLIPTSSINSEYCENNFNLISPSNCPVCSGGVSNWSSLFINNIQHLGASSIYMSIPEEIDRDYSYSNSGEIMEIEVDGYNVDYDYINNLVSIQKYKPSSEDFTNIVSNLGAYFKILLFLVFAFLVIKRVSKPFRSKIK